MLKDNGGGKPADKLKILPGLWGGQRKGTRFPAGGGAEGIRTPDPHNAIVVLYQLSYDPNGRKSGRHHGNPPTGVKSFS